MIRTAALLALALSLAAPAAGGEPIAEKRDHVTLENGDRILGEIKGLDRGVLSFKTDSAGTLSVKWDEVLALTTPAAIQVELDDGTRHFGSLIESPKERTLAILLGQDLKVVDTLHVVRLRSVKDSFTDRLTGRFSLGFSYTKASDVAQLSFSGSATYLEQKYRVDLSLNSISTSQAEAPSTRRDDLSLSYTRFLPQRWFARGILLAESNDELGLDLRTSLTAAAGRYLVYDHIQRFSLYGGVSANREVPAGDTETTRNLEGLAGAGYERYINHTPKVDLSTSLNLYPSISDFGRVRGQYSLSARKEIVEDLFLELSFYASYDSDPPSEGAERFDYGVVTSLGYSF